MTIGFIFFALTIDSFLCLVIDATEESFWLDELIEDNYVESRTSETRMAAALLQS